jgi:molecular chaperone HtpG
MATLEKTKVDLTGLMRVLGEALYSTPFVALRELVQNAHDACTRRQLETTEPFEARIDVRLEGQTLVIEDNGAGLTDTEIRDYLATVGAGYTRTLRDASAQEALIGYFGLGFLSAFAIADKVEFWSTSYQSPSIGHRFTSRSGESFVLEVAESRAIGTQLRLQLNAYISNIGDADVIVAWLRRYCCLLQHPVFFDHYEQINAALPPWRLPQEVSALRRKALSLEFAKRFERYFEPLTTMPISPSDDNDHLHGIFWIQDGATYASSDNRSLSIFVRGMLIGEEQYDLLPRWAGFVGGVIESAKLAPTASRETLKKDRVYEDTAGIVRRALIDGLVKLAHDDPAAWRRVLLRHNDALLGAAIADPELFDLLADQVTVPTSEGPLLTSEVRERSEGKIYLRSSDQSAAEEVLYRALKQPVVFGNRFAAAPFCNRYAQARGIALVMLGTQEGDSQVFGCAQLNDTQIEFLQASFSAPDRDVQIREFKPSVIPFLLIVDRNAELKRRIEGDEADKRIGHAILGLARQFTKQLQAEKLTRLYINSTNPSIQALLTAAPERQRLALALFQPLIALSSEAKAKVDIQQCMTEFDQAVVAILQERDGD